MLNEKLAQQFNAKFKQVTPGQRVRFRCLGCGDCCRHNRDVVVLESQDAYRLAKYFGLTMTEVIDKYTDMRFITEELPFPVFLLKTTGVEDSCIFLEDNRCTVQKAKPRTCRLYPFCAEPMEPNAESFNWFLCMERPHHFKNGNLIQVKNWMKRNFDPEDRQFVKEEWRSIAEITLLVQALQLQGISEKALLSRFLFFRYFDFDMNKPFLEQQRDNNQQLAEQLRELMN